MCRNCDIAREVIRGNWGNGEERKRRLRACGYDYGRIQNIVNALLGYKKRHPPDYETICIIFRFGIWPLLKILSDNYIIIK